MEFRLHADDVVRHFKGGIYTIMAMAVREFNGDDLGVLYVRNTDGSLWLRPYEMFVSEVDREKYPDVTQQYRMEKITDLEPEHLSIHKYDLCLDNMSTGTVFKHKETKEPYMLISNNYTHTETKVIMAVFVGINDEIPQYMAYDKFKECMEEFAVTRDNIHTLYPKQV